MNNPGHISESLETIFWVKILKLFDAGPDPGWKNSDPESGINIRNTAIPYGEAGSYLKTLFQAPLKLVFLTKNVLCIVTMIKKPRD